MKDQHRPKNLGQTKGFFRHLKGGMKVVLILDIEHYAKKQATCL